MPMADRVGQMLGNYRLLQLLGSGGFADVYLGKHVHLNTHAAIKVLSGRLKPEDLLAFRQEAQMIAQLAHPHILRILDFGDEQGIPFLVMEYAAQGTLRDQHPRNAIVPLHTVLDHLKCLASALQYAHDHKVIHRDIKPDNMLVDKNNTVLISDFGIALMGHTSSRYDSAGIAGTALYMAPEQLQGKPRRASDQYALGVVVYEWLCGDLPFHGNFQELASQHMFVPPPSLQQRVPHISATVEQVVFTALEKDPEHRFQNIEAFVLKVNKNLHQMAIKLTEKDFLNRLSEKLNKKCQLPQNTVSITAPELLLPSFLKRYDRPVLVLRGSSLSLPYRE